MERRIILRGGPLDGQVEIVEAGTLVYGRTPDGLQHRYVDSGREDPETGLRVFESVLLLAARDAPDQPIS